MCVSIQNSSTDHVLFIRQILEKKWEYNAVHHLFSDFKKSYELFS